MISAAAAMLLLGMDQAVPAPPVPPSPPPAGSYAPPAIYPPPIIVAPVPSPPAPPTGIRRPPLKQRARARAPLQSLLRKGDYPSIALRSNRQGIVGFRLDVGPDGRVDNCIVTASSGSAALDFATCRILRARAGFDPARDHLDRPASDRFAGRVAWRINRRLDRPFEPFTMVEEMRSDAAGTLSCWSARDGEPAAPKPCSGPTGLQLAALARSQNMPLALSIVVRLTPQGMAQPADDDARGDLYSLSDARLTIARDGSILECQIVRRTWVGGGNRGTPPNPCIDWYPRMRLYAPAPEGAPARIVDVTVRSYAKHSIGRPTA
jgi:protein TonB